MSPDLTAPHPGSTATPTTAARTVDQPEVGRTQNTAQAQHRKPPPSTSRSASGRLVLLLILLLFVALGGAAWQGMNLYRSERAAFETNQAALQARLDTLDAALQAAEQRARARGDDLARVTAAADSLQTRVGQLETALGSLQSAQQSGRSLAQLLAIEQLLMLAAERLHLAHDVDTANRALGLADERLASLRDPRLLPLRETLADLRHTLRATPTADTTAMILTLSSLIERAPELPLSSSLPAPLDTSAIPPASPEPSWWQRMARSLRATLAQIFIVHHDTGPQPQLLSTEQRALIGHVLMLRLEGARAALQQKDAIAFRLQCESALRWIEQYFERSRPDVQTAASTLRELMTMPLETPLPDLAPVAAQLRALIDDQQAAANSAPTTP